ncbi:MAG: HNH endonuclease, partial [Candidatus Binatia bacterium]
APSFLIDFSAPASVGAMFRQAVVAWCEADEPLWKGLERLLLHVSAEWRQQAGKPDRILDRDRFRCLVPACSSRRNLHVHHFTFRSAGGGDEPENLGAACAAHHLRGIHAGKVRARGRAPADIIWELGVRPDRPPLVRLRGDVYLDGEASR